MMLTFLYPAPLQGRELAREFQEIECQVMTVEAEKLGTELLTSGEREKKNVHTCMHSCVPLLCCRPLPGAAVVVALLAVHLLLTHPPTSHRFRVH